jgi:predicted RecA/RadA family phage recombinase
LYAFANNAEAVTITKGQAVYLFGASGNKASVKLANNTGDPTSAKTLGLAAEDIAAGQNGMIICQGVLEQVSTTGFPDGTSLYLGATPGSLTSTKPYAPNHLVYIGTVEKGNSNSNGKIYVLVQNGYELDELHDVDLITVPPVNNDVLTYVTGVNNLWKPKSITSILGYTPQNKSIAAYSMLVNNTAAPADMATTEYQTAAGAYTGTIAWTGTTPPSGATDHTFRWQRVGSVVTMNIVLVYATAGSSLTAVSIELPSGAPTPIIPSGLSGNSSVLYPCAGHMSLNLTISANGPRSALRTNSTNTGFELTINQASANYRYAELTVTYFAT